MAPMFSLSLLSIVEWGEDIYILAHTTCAGLVPGTTPPLCPTCGRPKAHPKPSKWIAPRTAPRLVYAARVQREHVTRTAAIFRRGEFRTQAARADQSTSYAGQSVTSSGIASTRRPSTQKATRRATTPGIYKQQAASSKQRARGGLMIAP